MSDASGTASVAEMRCQLAVASRMLVDLSILGYSGHLSARVGGPGSRGGREHLLIQPVDEPRSGLAPEQVLEVDFDGVVVEGDGAPPNELAIHSEIYRARPDVGAVAHVHHDATTMFTMVDGATIVPVKNHASRWARGVPVYPDPSHVSSPEKGRALAAALGDANAVLLRAHGEAIAAEDIPSLFADVVHFVENAHALSLAMTMGKVVALSDEECERFLTTFRRTRHAAKVWKFYTSGAVERGLVSGEWVSGWTDLGRDEPEASPTSARLSAPDLAGQRSS